MVLFSSNPREYQSVTDAFKSLFFAILKDGASRDIVAKYWLTGVLPAFREGISPLAATEILSNKLEFHGLCGLDDAEVQTIAETFLSALQREYDIAAVMHELRQWYNGYRFATDNPSQPAAPLYNPQLVFMHLRGLAKGRFVEPRDDREAPHISKALDDIGDETFLDDFILAASSKLESSVRYQILPSDSADPGTKRWVPQTLLYFFGVLTYAKNPGMLTIPNEGMQQAVRSTRCI